MPCEIMMSVPVRLWKGPFGRGRGQSTSAVYNMHSEVAILWNRHAQLQGSSVVSVDIC